MGNNKYAASPLTEGRGLKLEEAAGELESQAVAPHGGAWIETRIERKRDLFE